MSIAIPAAAPANPRQRRHSMATVRLARAMYGDGDSWQPHAIARYLTRQGTPVHHTTVRRWLFPAEAEQQRQANRESARRRNASSAARSGPSLPESPTVSMVDRIVQLYEEAGLGCAAIGRVIAVDFGIAPLSRDQVSLRLRAVAEGRTVKDYALRRSAGSTSSSGEETT